MAQSGKQRGFQKAGRMCFGLPVRMGGGRRPNAVPAVLSGPILRDAQRRFAGGGSRRPPVQDIRFEALCPFLYRRRPGRGGRPSASKGGRALETDEVAEPFSGKGIGPPRPGVFPLPAGRRKSSGGAAASRPPPVRGQSAPHPDRSGSASAPLPLTGRRTGKSPAAASDPERGSAVRSDFSAAFFCRRT